MLDLIHRNWGLLAPEEGAMMSPETECGWSEGRGGPRWRQKDHRIGGAYT
jgi:hypothetical protein